MRGGLSFLGVFLATAASVAAVAACLGDDAEAPVYLTPPDASGPTQETAGDSSVNAGDGSPEACACKPGIACIEGGCANDVVQLAAGELATCAVLRSGDLYCWGENADGELGEPVGANRIVATKIETDFLRNPFGGVAEVTLGSAHTCARMKSDGSVMCWGSASWRQFGQTTARPLAMANVSGYKSIKASSFATCGIDGSNVVRCWGQNQFGVLGHAPGTEDDESTTVEEATGTQTHFANVVPRAVKLGAVELQADAIAMGAFHACAVRRGTGEVHCWGDNQSAALGAGHADASVAGPVFVEGAVGAEGVFLGGASSCVVRDGRLLCWGDNAAEQIGNGGDGGALVLLAPTTFGALEGAGLRSGAPGNSTICAAGDQVWCAGFNYFGTVGNGELDRPPYLNVATARKVQAIDGGGELEGVELIAAGALHVCVKTRNNVVACWGGNVSGQLGSGVAGPDAERPYPVPVVGLP